MFKFDEIRELIELVGSSGVSSVEVEHAGSRLRIEGRDGQRDIPFGEIEVAIIPARAARVKQGELSDAGQTRAAIADLPPGARSRDQSSIARTRHRREHGADH